MRCKPDAARKTLEGRRNIFIIQGMHEMNVQAANCLLKTLEEPEPDVVLLLTAPDPGVLLPTILSRVQQVPMQLLTTKQIKSALEDRWQVEPEEASLIAALAAGRMGWAVQAVEDEDMLAERQAQLETLAKLSTAGRYNALMLRSVSAPIATSYMVYLSCGYSGGVTWYWRLTIVLI